VGKDKVVPFLLEDKLKELGAKYEKVLLTTVHYFRQFAPCCTSANSCTIILT